MYKAVIVEDEEDCADILKEYLKRYEQENGAAFYVTCYKDGEAFLSAYKSDADIIFMDIQMPFVDGYRASMKFRESDSNAKLVFVTNMAQYAIKGYQVEASDFIVKPINYLGFEALMKRLLRQIDASREEDSIVLHLLNSVEKVNLRDILYIEVMNHTIIYHTENKDMELFGSLTECEKQLAGKNFARCSSSYVVNLRYVTSYDRTSVTIAEKITLPISRGKGKAFIASLNAYLMGEE